MRMCEFEFKHENGHVVVYKNGEFYATAASLSEAVQDLMAEGEL